MSREADAALQAKILQIGFVLVFVVAVLFGVRSMMYGSFSKTGLVAMLTVGAGLVFLLDDRYWVLCPFLSSSGIALPGLPFNGTELGCVVLVGVYFIRLGLRRSPPVCVDQDNLVLFPVLGWMFFVWTLNPVGLAMFGNSVIGGRFYFEIAIGVLALFILSSLRFSEKDAKFLFYAILSAQCWTLVHGIVFPEADPDTIVFAGDAPEVSTRYAFIVCSSIFILLFARHPLSSILKSFPKIILFSLLALLTLYSGKRRAFGAIVLVPFFRVVLTGKDRLLTMVMALFAAIMLAFAIAGDGVVYDLPRSAKRVLAVVHPEYKESRITGGMQDFFREQMREQARYVIKENPWFGRKGFAMNLEETVWINFGRGYTSSFAGHAYSGNWHSTWYAFAADFGIPCMVFYALFFLYVLRYCWKASHEVVEGTYLPACCLYYSLAFFVSAAFSYTSGHSARTLLGHCIMYGLLLAIVHGYRERHGGGVP